MIRPPAARLAAIAAFPASAAPPYGTDDPGVLAAGEIEIIPSIDVFSVKGPNEGAVTLEANLGVMPGLQAGASVPVYQFAGGEDGFETGDITLSAKWTVRAGEPGQIAIAAGPAVTLPTHRHSGRQAELSIPLWIGTEWDGWTMQGGGGMHLAADRDGGDRAYGGVVMRHMLSDRVTIGAELQGEGRGTSRHGIAQAGPGVEIGLTDHILLVGAAHAILAHRADHGRWHVYSALVITP